MNFLRRLANSAYVQSHFRWPSARTLRFYWLFIAVISVVSCADAMSHGYRHAASTGLANPVLSALAAGSLTLFAWAMLGPLLLFMWGLYYRMGTEFVTGFRRFHAWLPGAFQGMVRAAAAFVRFLLAIPSYLGAFFRAIGRAFLWIAGRPAWWRSLTGKQKLSVLFSTVLLGLYAGTAWMFYPVARHLSNASPSWFFMSDQPMFQRIFFDMFLSMLIFVFEVLVLSIIVDVVAHFFRKR